MAGNSLFPHCDALSNGGRWHKVHVLDGRGYVRSSTAHHIRQVNPHTGVRLVNFVKISDRSSGGVWPDEERAPRSPATTMWETTTADSSRYVRSLRRKHGGDDPCPQHVENLPGCQ
jgi:hypothetical protein